jgi:glycosyltransferase involved in cell wall biosynthesis
VRDGVDGRLVPPGDPDALAAALLGLAGDAATRERFAARAPEVLERFGPAAVFPRWDALLDRL